MTHLSKTFKDKHYPESLELEVTIVTHVDKPETGVIFANTRDPEVAWTSDDPNYSSVGLDFETSRKMAKWLLDNTPKKGD